MLVFSADEAQSNNMQLDFLNKTNTTELLLFQGPFTQYI